MTERRCPTCGQRMEHLASSVSIYGMYDCHSFHKVKGTTVDEVIANWEQHNREEQLAVRPDGSEINLGKSTLCPAIVIGKTDGPKTIELRRVGKAVMPVGKYSNTPDHYTKQLAAYRQALLTDPDIPRLLETQATEQQEK